MSAKLRVLAQSLISELNESKGINDTKSSKTEWWRQLDWKAPDHRTLFDSLGEETRKLIVEAGLVKDDLVSEEYQGNAASMTESKRAQMFFSIPEDEWARLSEEEKDDYISRLPPKKTKAGGEEMSNRDCKYPWADIKAKLLESDKVDATTLLELWGEMTGDGESVTITAETKTKLSELGIDLDPCECNEEDTEHKHCPEGEVWSEEHEKCVSADETISDEVVEEETDEKPPREVLKDFNRIMDDVERLVR